ncbi:hypothetical protein CASFOL_017935 [Castilleja foliolosa]|uniref:Uncharacterized protein n=1 Tax=Castilleja foliolosa TaxID=1961234 RepID=A0ABD3D9M3_9LAMI
MADNGDRIEAYSPVSEVNRTDRPSLKLRVVLLFYRPALASNNRSLEIGFTIWRVVV